MTDIYDWNQRRTHTTTPPRPVIQPSTAPGGGYAATALANELQTLLDTTEGSRNDQLNIAAFNLGQLVAAGHLDEPTVHDQLRAAALQVGLELGETEATIRSGLRGGAQSPRQVQPLRLAAVEEAPASSFPTTNEAGTGPGDADSPGAARTSWWPAPIGQRAVQAAEEPAPTHLYRDDQQALFYSGKVNGLIGESESGKSWIALLAVVQAITQGQRVLVLDFEDSPASVHRRLQAFGCQPAQLELVDYANPDESLGVLQSQDLSEAIAANYRVIVADGINAAMTLLGYDLNSNTDATLFSSKLLRPLAKTGACVITVDHVPKNPEARGKGGIGAQAKRAMLDGCALLVEVLEPFGKGQSGTLRLTVDKDRNGAVRGISSGGRYAGKAQLDSIADQVRITITAPDSRPAEERPAWRPTGLMESVSRLLEDAVQPMSGREITDDVHGKAQNIRHAIAELVKDGYVTATARSGRGGGDIYTSAKPFREADETTPQEVRPSASEPRPGRGSESASRPVSPSGDGTHFDDTPDAPQDGSASRTQIDKQPGLDMPDDHSSCNHCGKTTPDREIDDNAGYCHECARLWGNR